MVISNHIWYIYRNMKHIITSIDNYWKKKSQLFKGSNCLIWNTLWVDLFPFPPFLSLKQLHQLTLGIFLVIALFWWCDNHHFFWQHSLTVLSFTDRYRKSTLASALLIWGSFTKWCFVNYKGRVQVTINWAKFASSG